MIQHDNLVGHKIIRRTCTALLLFSLDDLFPLYAQIASRSGVKVEARARPFPLKSASSPVLCLYTNDGSKKSG